MPKTFKFGREAREALMKGVDLIYNCVKVTLGPMGHNVVLGRNFGGPLITKDGVTVAKELSAKDSFVNLGLEAVKEVSVKTAADVGDGTTTAVIIARGLLASSLRELNKGCDHVVLREEIHSAMDMLISRIESQSIAVDSREAVLDVALSSSNQDQELADLIAEAYNKIGPHGILSHSESQTGRSYVEAVNGYQLNRGYISPYFVTDQKAMRCIMESPDILVTDKVVSTAEDVVKLLERAAQSARPLLILADDVVGEALNTMIINNVRGVVKCCAVKLPAAGAHREKIMEDVAILTGAGVITSNLNRAMSSVNADDYGSCDKIIVERNECTFVGGKGNEETINGRIEQIQEALDSGEEVPFNEQRLGKLKGGVGVIYVGGSTESEIKERDMRADDAIMAIKAALDGGVVCGSGGSIIQAAVKDFGLERPGKFKWGVPRRGTKILISACLSPSEQIIANAGDDPKKILKEVFDLIEAHPGSFGREPASGWKDGYDARKREIVNLKLAGIVDPTKVVTSAIRNAVSISELLLMSDCLVVDDPEAGASPPAPMM